MPPIIRKISVGDNPYVARIIRTVMPEFGAGGKGFAIHDKEVDDMFTAYSGKRAAYFVCEEDGAVLGCGGVAPLEGGPGDTCELRKMYFLPAGRGRGLGQKLLTSCLDAARERGFKNCYIETFNTMKDAMKLYEKNGFQKIPGSLGNTGHYTCDTFYLLRLY
ncbi:MAG TPA: GNAT family N-acetyltransferase [Chryseosolibacter sp.]|nr:GNAT family N-acetyltransferase [Chryseosolibacter sp.]